MADFSPEGSIDSTSLRLPRRLNLIIVASHLMFTLVGMVTWVDVGGGCYRVVLEHGCALLGLCVDHDFMLIAYVSLYMYSMCLFHLHGVYYGCSDVAM